MIQIAYHEQYFLPLPEGHRFPMEKYRQVPLRLLESGFLNEENFFKPDFRFNEAIGEVHDSSYVNALNNGTLDYYAERKIGFPYTKEMVRREELICGGSIEGALKSLKTGFPSFNVAGGTHHAFRSHGEAYCIYNDMAVAAQYLLDEKLASRILILDLDVHQGNGTASIFENNPDVFTFSIHSQKSYPLRKENSDEDVSISENICDLDYLNLLEEKIPSLIDRFQPDFVFYQAGVDILKTDKLGKMGLSLEACKKRDEFVFRVCKSYHLPMMVTAGGGYSENLEDIIQAHCNTYFAALELNDSVAKTC